MNKKIIFVLIFVVAICVAILFYLKKKEKNAAALTAPAQNANSNNTTTATQPFYPSYPQQPQGVYTPPIFSGGTTPMASTVNATALIKIVQAAFGLKVDGVLGEKTKAAIASNGIDLSSEQKFIDKMLSINDADYKKYFPLKKGSKNNYVKGLQLFLNIKPDGNFGAGTEAAAIKATGSPVVFHKQYSELFTAYTNMKIAYKGKPLENTSIMQNVKNLFGGIVPHMATK
jgi:hypothetical protein